VAGGYGEQAAADEGPKSFALNVERLVEAADAAERRLG